MLETVGADITQAREDMMLISRKELRKVIQGAYEKGIETGYVLGFKVGQNRSQPIITGKTPHVIEQAEEILRNGR